MGSADGRSNPFNSDGKSGAVGNGAGSGKTAGFDPKRQGGPDRPQRMGATNFNPDSVPRGGRVFNVDVTPKDNRDGLVGDRAGQGRFGKGPFKLGNAGGPQMPESNAPANKGGPVGDIPAEDFGTGGQDD